MKLFIIVQSPPYSSSEKNFYEKAAIFDFFKFLLTFYTTDCQVAYMPCFTILFEKFVNFREKLSKLIHSIEIASSFNKSRIQSEKRSTIFSYFSFFRQLLRIDYKTILKRNCFFFCKCSLNERQII